MEILILSFVAGLLTVLAPCVLPILPIIVGGSLEDDNKWRPYIIIGSLAFSIVIFTLLLKASTILIGLDDSFWKIVSGGIIIFFGVITIFPNLWTKISEKMGFGQKSHELLHKSAEKKGFTGNILMGMSLGPVFASCSPTYALIVAVVLPQSFGFGLLNLAVYAVGLALILLLVAKLGQKFISKAKWASDPNGIFKRSLGVLFILVGVAIITGFDKTIETAILDSGFFNVAEFEQSILDKTGLEDELNQ